MGLLAGISDFCCTIFSVNHLSWRTEKRNRPCTFWLVRDQRSRAFIVSLPRLKFVLRIFLIIHLTGDFECLVTVFFFNILPFHAKIDELK